MAEVCPICKKKSLNCMRMVSIWLLAVRMMIVRCLGSIRSIGILLIIKQSRIGIVWQKRIVKGKSGSKLFFQQKSTYPDGNAVKLSLDLLTAVDFSAVNML